MVVRQHWSEFSTILYADDNIDSPVWVTCTIPRLSQFHSYILKIMLDNLVM